jgi:hypothetical protein
LRLWLLYFFTLVPVLGFAMSVYKTDPGAAIAVELLYMAAWLGCCLPVAYKRRRYARKALGDVYYEAWARSGFSKTWMPTDAELDAYIDHKKKTNELASAKRAALGRASKRRDGGTGQDIVWRGE